MRREGGEVLCQVHNSVDSGPYVDVLGRSTGIERPHLSAAEYVAAVIDELEIDWAELASRGRKPETVRMRELLAVVGVERYRVSVKGLAEVLGRNRVTVSSWISRGSEKRARVRSFEQQVDELDSRLARRRP